MLINIEINDLQPKNCNQLYNFIDLEVNLSTKSRAISILENDLLSPEIPLKDYLIDYFNGVKYEVKNKISEEEILLMPFVDKIDLLYRINSTLLEAELINGPISLIIKSKRIFSICKIMSLQKIIDLYIEKPENSEKYEIINNEDVYESYNFIISHDYSSKIINNNYYIHSGTNNWNRVWNKNKKWTIEWRNQLLTWQNQLKKAEIKSLELADIDYAILVVPEKDAVARICDKDFTNSSLLPMLYMHAIADKLNKNKFIYPLFELFNSTDWSKSFAEADSHLSSYNYLVIVNIILNKWGLPEIKTDDYQIVQGESNGDLSEKFKNTANTVNKSIIQFSVNRTSVVFDGSRNFCNPLRSSFVSLRTDEARFKKRLLILGDSHSSLGYNPYLTYIFTNFFEQVDFYWNPCYLYDEKNLNNVKYDYVLSEISQRFIMPNLNN